MEKLNVIFVAVNLSAKMIVTALFKNLSNALFLTNQSKGDVGFADHEYRPLFPDLDPARLLSKLKWIN